MPTGSPQEQRREVEQRILSRALEDESYRTELLRDPRRAVERELGMKLPEGIELRAVEETDRVIYLVVPRQPDPASRSRDLSDKELETVAGGAYDHCICDSSHGCDMWTMRRY